MAISRTVSDVTRMAVEVIQQESLPVSVIGSVASCGGSAYVEIFVAVDRRDRRRCLQVGVFRDADIEGLRREILRQIADRLASEN